MRHGSRYPDPGTYENWVALSEKVSNSNFKGYGPLEFLPGWQLDMTPGEVALLSPRGRGEMYDLGVELRYRYLNLYNDSTPFTVWSAGQERVINSAQSFAQGFVGLNWTRLATLYIQPDSVNYTFANSLTASAACPAYSNNGGVYQTNYENEVLPQVVKRLQPFVPGYNLTQSDVQNFQYLCGYEAEMTGNLEFCNVFTEQEWYEYEYGWDLNYFYGSGPGNSLGNTVGFPYVNATLQLLLAGPNSTEIGQTGQNVPSIIMSFTHDNDLGPVIASLGIQNNTALNNKTITENRQFYSSRVMPFGGRIAFERMSCRDQNKYVRVLVNDAVNVLPGCDSGPGGMCELSKFASYIEQRGVLAGDFVKTCGITASNATSLLTIFSNPPPTCSSQC